MAQVTFTRFVDTSNGSYATVAVDYEAPTRGRYIVRYYNAAGVHMDGSDQQFALGESAMHAAGWGMDGMVRESVQ